LARPERALATAPFLKKYQREETLLDSCPGENLFGFCVSPLKKTDL
jgi:hypothetical protein